MADKNLKSLHPFLQETLSKVSSGGTVKGFSHDHGSGPVFVLAHGWPQSAYMWRHVVADLKDKISFYVAELPGYGFSSLPPKNDKRTVGNLIVEAVRDVFGKDRSLIWCGHDRGGRIGHRLIVDNTSNIQSAILIDIVPTTEQWRASANPRAIVGYYHWPFLAIDTAPQMIEAMGAAEFCRINLNRAKGGNEVGTAKFRENDAVDHYCHQFSNAECIAGSCGDYAAGATVDVDEQKKDQDAGKKVTIPLMVIYSASNLGKMHDVEKAWSNWVESKDVRYEGIPDGFGHYLPEECPERIIPLLLEWIQKYK